MTTTRRALTGAVVCVVVVVMAALPAAAHVEVTPEDGTTVEVGGNATFTVRVPNERDVGTVGVELIFPTTFETVTVQPTSGWIVAAEHENAPAGVFGDVPLVLVHDGEDHEEPAPTEPAPTVAPSASAAAPETFENASALVWTGGPTGPDEIIDFVITVGPVPDTPVLVFKALQTYEGGEVVRWIQEPSADGSEPEFPAPTLEVSGATPVADDTDDTGDTVATDDTSEEAADAADSSDSDTWKTILIVVAVVLIIGGITARVVVQRRMHRAPPE